jgi:hypothetical protein
MARAGKRESAFRKLAELERHLVIQESCPTAAIRYDGGPR